MSEVNEQTSKADEPLDMDLLSLTFRSLDFNEGILKKEDILQVPRDDSHDKNGSSKDRLRNLRQSKEDSWRPSRDPSSGLRTITLDEVAWHDTVDNCWVVIYDYVYDCTEFLDSHPGGADVLLEYAGRDATLAFVGTGHSSAASKSLERYLIGELPVEERLFRVPDGVQVAGIGLD